MRLLSPGLLRAPALEDDVIRRVLLPVGAGAAEEEAVRVRRAGEAVEIGMVPRIAREVAKEIAEPPGRRSEGGQALLLGRIAAAVDAVLLQRASERAHLVPRLPALLLRFPPMRDGGAQQ